MDDRKTIPGDRANPIRINIKHEGDRRIYSRVPTMSVQTKVKIKPALILSSDWQMVQMIDYNRKGLGFESKKQFKLGQSIQVYLHLKIESTDITLDDLVANIKSIALEENGFRYGTAFDFTANEYMQSKHVQSKLSGLEGVIRRALKAKARPKSKHQD